ncbi:MAG: glycosyltransferase [Bacteroidota bacterium]
MNKKVLYISYDGMTDPLGQSQVLPYLCGLSERGFRFTLISCEKPDRFEAGASVIRDICRKAQIDWQPITYTKRPPVLSTLYDLRQMKKLAFRLHAAKQFDLVHCRSYQAAMIGQEMKQQFGVKFLFDMRGFWADERVEGGLWSLSNPVYKRLYQYIKNKERSFFTEADYNISLTQAGKREIQSWDLPLQPVPFEVIPCCADLNHFDYNRIPVTQTRALRQRLGIRPIDFVLGYLGSIGTWYCLTEMLQFFKLLSQNESTVRFMFVTREDPQLIYEKAKQLGIDPQSLIIRSASRKEVPLYLSTMDCGLFFIKPVFSKTASSPTKQAEMMAMGLPIICNDIGDTGAIVRNHEVGIALDDLSPASMREAIHNLPALMSLSKVDIRQAAIKEFALTEGIRKYESTYNKVLTSKLTYA